MSKSQSEFPSPKKLCRALHSDYANHPTHPLWSLRQHKCLHRLLNAVVASFNKEKALLVDFSLIVKLQTLRLFISSSITFFITSNFMIFIFPHNRSGWYQGRQVHRRPDVPLHGGWLHPGPHGAGHLPPAVSTCCIIADLVGCFTFAARFRISAIEAWNKITVSWNFNCNHQTSIESVLSSLSQYLHMRQW